MRIATLIFCLATVQAFAGDTLYNVVTVNGKQGLKDEQGNFVIPPKYDEIGWTKGPNVLHDGIIGYKREGKWGLINIENEHLTSAKYTNLTPYQKRKFIASIKGKFSSTTFFGVVTEEGKVLVNFKYYMLKPANDKLMALSKVNNQFTYGLIDQNGNQLLSFKYASINSLSDHLIKLELTSDSVRIYNTSTKTFIKGGFTSASSFKDQYILLHQQNKVGVIDQNGKMLIEPSFEEIDYSQESGWRVKNSTVWSVIDKDYQVVKKLECQDVNFVDDFIKVSIVLGERLLDSDFTEVTPNLFDKILSKTGSKILYKNKSKYGLYDVVDKSYMKVAEFDSAYVAGQFVYGARSIKNQIKWALYDTFGIKRTHFDYDEINIYDNRLFAVKKRGHWGFIDRVGKEVIHCVYSEVGKFKDQLVVVKYHNQYGVIDKENNWKVLPQKDKIEIINAKLYLTKGSHSTKLMSIDDELIYFTHNKLEPKGDILIETLTTGEKQVISLQGTFMNNGISSKINSSSYESMKYHEDEYLAVKKNGRYGFVDRQNTLRITNRYEDVGRYSEKGIPIKLLGKWGVINTNEEIIIQPTYDSIAELVNGMSIVKLGAKYGLISQSGKEIVTPTFDDITRLDNGEYLTWKDEKYGLIAPDGKYLIDTKYDELIRLDNGKIIVKKRNFYGTLTLNGVEVIPNIYNMLYYHPKKQLYFAKQEGQWRSLVLSEHE